MASRVREVKRRFEDCVSLLKDELETVNSLYRGIHRGDSEQLIEKIERMERIKVAVSRDKMRVVFFGKTSNGKSTVINALLGRKVCPTGYGSVTGCFCSVEKGLTSYENAAYYVCDVDHSSEVDDFVDVQFTSLESAISFFGEQHVTPSTIISIQWPEEQCPLLKDDVAIIDTPGIDAEVMVDDCITKICSDADVFVYVCDGKRTIEEKEKEFLVRVKSVLSNLTANNLFILFNWWDAVCSEENADRVRNQHEEKAKQFLKKEFDFDENSAKDRIFFISAKEALLRAAQAQPSFRPGPVPGEQKRYIQFCKFKRDLQKCLTDYGLQTKLGRHCDSARSVIQTTLVFLEQEMHRQEERRKQLLEEIEDLASSQKNLSKGEGVLNEKYIECRKAASEEVAAKVTSSIASAKKEIEEQVKRFKGTYAFFGLEQFKSTMITGLKPSYSRVYKKLEEDLTSVYKKAESDLTSEFKKFEPPAAKQRTRTTKPVCDEKNEDFPDLFGVKNMEVKCSISTFKNAMKHVLPQGMGEKVGAAMGGIVGTGSGIGLGVAVVTTVATPVTVVSGVGFGIATVGYFGYKAIRAAFTDDMKEAVKSQVIQQLCSQLDEQASTLTGEYDKKVQEKLKSQVDGCSDIFKWHLEQLLQKEAERKTEKTRVENYKTEVEKFREGLHKVDQKFNEFERQFEEEKDSSESYWP